MEIRATNSICRNSLEQIQVIVMENHGFVLDSNGILWAWGDNSLGLLGDGTYITRDESVKIMEDVLSIQVFNFNEYRNMFQGDPPLPYINIIRDIRIFIITADNKLWAWGNNHFGQLGDGTYEDRNTPVLIMNNVAYVSSVRRRTFAITTDMSLYGWGLSSGFTVGYGNYLGDGTDISRNAPVWIMDNVATIHPGWDDTFAITTDGALYGWGRNISGRLGIGTNRSASSPMHIMDSVAGVFRSSSYTLAVCSDGGLYVWGNLRGSIICPDCETAIWWNAVESSGVCLNCGFCVFENEIELPQIWGREFSTFGTPHPVRIMEGVARIYDRVETNTSLLLKMDGTLWRFTNMEMCIVNVFTPVHLLDGVQSVIRDGARNGRIYAITTNGVLYGWVGWSGQNTPAKIMEGVESVHPTMARTFAITNSGELYGWGRINLGAGELMGSTKPIQIMDSVLSISTHTIFRSGGEVTDGNGTNIALRTDGSLWIWQSIRLISKSDYYTFQNDERCFPTKFIEGIFPSDVVLF